MVNVRGTGTRDVRVEVRDRARSIALTDCNVMPAASKRRAGKVEKSKTENGLTYRAFTSHTT